MNDINWRPIKELPDCTGTILIDVVSTQYTKQQQFFDVAGLYRGGQIIVGSREEEYPKSSGFVDMYGWRVVRFAMVKADD